MKMILLFLALSSPIVLIAQDQKSILLEKRIEELEKKQIKANIRIEKLEKQLLLNLKNSKQKEIKATSTPEVKAKSLVKVVVTNKRFQDTDLEKNIYEQSLWFNIDYQAVGLKKKARAIKGTLEFADLFGEVHFSLNSTLNKPLEPKKSVQVKGYGFKYNQFLSKHTWMRTTKLKDMKISLKVHSIIYSDGTSAKFEE